MTNIHVFDRHDIAEFLKHISFGVLNKHMPSFMLKYIHKLYIFLTYPLAKSVSFTASNLLMSNRLSPLH